MPSTNRVSRHDRPGDADRRSYHPKVSTDWSSPEPETIQQGLDELADRIASRLRVRFLFVENPTATDVFPLGFISRNVTIAKIRGETDVGTVDFNVEWRSFGSADTAGTDTLTGDLQATATGATSTAFSDATVPAETWLVYAASAVSGSPTKLWVAVEYTVD